MSKADDFKKLRDSVLAQGIEDPDGDARLVFKPDTIKPQWQPMVDKVRSCSYLVSYAAQGHRWLTIMSPQVGYGLAEVLNSAILQGDDVSYVRVTRLDRHPDHKE
jgi:hypothetical protein